MIGSIGRAMEWAVARPGRFAVLSAAFELSLVPLGLIIQDLWGGPAAPWEASPAAVGLGLLGALPPAALLFWLRSPRWRDVGPIREIFRRLRDLLGPVLGSLRWYHAVPLCLAAGIGEEFLFRGVLQARLGLVPAALLFGALHPLTPTYALLAGAIGGFFGWLQAESGNLVVPALAHAAYDGLAFIVLRREMRRAPPSP
jgi:uncharacterized protein